MALGRDEEFRRLFAEEASSRLVRLGALLLELESGGAGEDLMAAIFREAHTLKGAAAVVGVDDVVSVAHAMEDLFQQLRDGTRTPPPAGWTRRWPPSTGSRT